MGDDAEVTDKDVAETTTKPTAEGDTVVEEAEHMNDANNVGSPITAESSNNAAPVDQVPAQADEIPPALSPESVPTPTSAAPATDVGGSNAKESSRNQKAGDDETNDEPEAGNPAAENNVVVTNDDNKTTKESANTVETELEEAATSTPAPSSPKRPESNPIAIVSSNKKSRPPYKYDPDKITLRFLFANRDGLTVTVECRPNDTVGEVKGALLSVWPEDLPNCAGGDRLRLVCMGKGLLMPDSRTLEDCQVPVFKTHPTPVNVSVKPDLNQVEVNQKGKDGENSGNASADGTPQSSQGCACIIL